MISEPKLEECKEQPYMGIRAQVTMQELGIVIPQLIGDVFAWLEKQGVVAVGPPLVRYLVINMKEKLDIEIAVPVGSVLAGDGRVSAGALPAGLYASLVYTGADNGIKGNTALLEWGARQGLVWDTWQAENGDGFGARFESLLTNPADEPDPAKWDTEVAIRLADGNHASPAP